jgi:acetyltransferase
VCALITDGLEEAQKVPKGPKVEQRVFQQITRDALAQGRSALSEIESKQILEELGLPTTLPILARSAQEACDLARKIGFPVVLKVSSPDVTHKSEIGGVALNLASADAV